MEHGSNRARIFGLGILGWRHTQARGHPLGRWLVMSESYPRGLLRKNLGRMGKWRLVGKSIEQLARSAELRGDKRRRQRPRTCCRPVARWMVNRGGELHS